MSGRDLVLEYTTVGNEGEEKFDSVILSNIPGRRYRIGSLYPGEVKGEDFIFCRVNQTGVVSPSHCVITVDELEQYWIQNDSTGDTFVNSEKVKALEPRLLKIGDVISLGYPGTWLARTGLRPIYHVKERVVFKLEAEDCTEEGLNNDAEESPLDNDLILSKIMSYLLVADLKNGRLVSKRWKTEASKFLEKKGQVSFAFGIEFCKPTHSTRVSRYLHEMNGLKLRNLYIKLYETDYFDIMADSSLTPQMPVLFTPGEPGEKLMVDLQNLLKSSHNFSSLVLKCCMSRSSKAEDFGPLFLIFQELGKKLVELKLDGLIFSLPQDLPPFPLMKNMKKYVHKGTVGHDLLSKWVCHIVPLLESLEHLECDMIDLEVYLPEFLKHKMPRNLTGIAITAGPIREKGLSLLLHLCNNSLTHLEISYLKYDSESGEDCTLLERLLFKNSKSLKHLQLKTDHKEKTKTIEIKFPSFPKLEELNLQFVSRTNIIWENTGDLDYYKKNLPSLLKLTIVEIADEDK